jgi:ribonuclease HI
VASEYVELVVFYTDGSLIEGSAGCADHRTGVGEFGFKLSSSADVCSAELSALFMALQHIREAIQPPEKCLILTGSLSSIKAMLSKRLSWQTHPLVYEWKQLCFDLMRDLIEVKLMWIPSHVRLVSNELVDEEARFVSLNGYIFDRPLSTCDFQGLARPVLLREWQRNWDLADTGQFAHSILAKVSLRPWFEGQKEGRSFVASVSRIISGHSSVRSHLNRFGIIEGPMPILSRVKACKCK